MKSKHTIKNHVRFKGEFKKEFKDEFPGRDLAEFIAEQLRLKNYVVNSVDYEEPWFTVNVVSGSIEYPLMVSHSAMGEDYWEISCPRTLRFFARFRGKSEDTELQNLVNTLDEILQDEQTIKDIKWYSDYSDLADDYVQKPVAKRLNIVGKYFGKLFLPLCLTGWILALIGGIRSGKESLLLLIGTIMFLLLLIVWLGLMVINFFVPLICAIKDSHKKRSRKKWLRWFFYFAIIAMLVGPFFLRLLRNPSADKIMSIIEKGFFRLAVLVMFVFLLFMFGSMFLVSFTRIFIPRYRKKRRKKEHFFLVGSFLVLIGVTGFLIGVFSALGLLKWVPKKFEFPLAGLAGIDVNGEGYLFTASKIYSRIQVYNQEGDFVRGWFLDDTGGGLLKIRINDKNEIVVVTAPGNSIYIFDENGSLLQSSKYDDAGYWNSFVQKGKHLFDEKRGCRYDVEGLVLPRIIQTGPDVEKKIGKNAVYLFPFQGPFQGLITAFIGGFFISRAEKKRKKKRS